jgi:hypothetical protein
MNQRVWSVIPLTIALVCAAAAPAQAQYTEAEASAETEATPPQAQLPYRGSLLIYEHATRLYAYADEELTYNPYYVHSLSFRPRWYFNDNVWGRLQLDLEQELTNADDTTTANEVRVVATTLDFNYSDFQLFENFNAAGRMTFGFPTDKISQLRTMYLSVAPRLALSYKIPSLAKGLTLGVAGTFTKYFNRYADGDVDVLQYCQGSRGTAEQCTATGVMNPNFRLLWEASAAFQILDNLAVTGTFLIYNTWAYDVPDSEVTTSTGEVLVERSDDDTRLRALNRFTLDVSYDITKYFGVSIGTDTYAGQLRADATYENPFFNRYTNFYVDLNLTIDELVKVVSPSGTASLGTRTAMAGR